MTTQRLRGLALTCFGLGSLTLATGCQVDVNGQTLPSPTYLQDDIQYFPPGPEFKLWQEANAMKTQGGGTASVPQGIGPE